MNPGRDNPGRELIELRAQVKALEAELASLRKVANQPDAVTASSRTPSGKTSFSSKQYGGPLRPQDAVQVFEMVQALTGVAVWRWDRDTGVCECSDAIRELFSLDDGETTRLEQIFERFHPEDRAKIRFDGRAQPSSDAIAPEEFRIFRPDGTMRRIVSTVTMLEPGPDENGGVWAGLVVDVTERCALQEELKNAQKMEALGRLAGGVAHDFNNYLTVALGNAEMLRASISQESSRSLLNEIIAASERCQGLTQRLLEFGRKRLVKAPVINILDVVAQTKALVGRLLPASMQLVVHCQEPELRVRIDAGKLEQALMNLVLNARDATDQVGTIELRIDVKTQPKPREMLAGGLAAKGPNEDEPYVRILVRDEGVGMDNETRERVFEPFFTTKPAGRGTGLGLSIVYGIVAQAGGSISVRSGVGEGTAFEIWLPLLSSARSKVGDSARPRPSDGSFA